MPEQAGFDRRTVLKAGAWAAPVVLLAAGTPAASASGEAGTVAVTRIIGKLATSDKGVFVYVMTAEVTNKTKTDLKLTIAFTGPKSDEKPRITFEPSFFVLSVPAGETVGTKDVQVTVAGNEPTSMTATPSPFEGEGKEIAFISAFVDVIPDKDFFYPADPEIIK